MTASERRTSARSALEATEIEAGYGEVRVLHDLTFELREGEILSIVGPNGAGKTTLMRVLAGLIEPTNGSVRLGGEEITPLPAHDRLTRGLALVSEERNLFRTMTVRENLVMGSYADRGEKRRERIARVYDLFPRLEERRDQRAGTLSGGEAQMLAIGRSLMADIDILMLDEPSLGLAPKLVPELFEKIREINDGGVSIVLVEQRANEALKLADSGCLLEDGTIVRRGDAAGMLADEQVIERYLGGV